jgi:hypothetical protein
MDPNNFDNSGGVEHLNYCFEVANVIYTLKLIPVVDVLNSAVVLHVRMKKITKISSHTVQLYSIVNAGFYYKLLI